MTEKRNWMQMDKCFCSASWGKCKNTNCYRYFGEPEKKYCEENLVKYSWPYEYEYRDSLPKTLVGKIAYKELENGK